QRGVATTLRRRRRLLAAVVVCVWGVVWARAFQLQIVDRDQLATVGHRQSDREVRIAAPRGEIFDRAGRLLAINVSRRSFFAYPGRETSPQRLAAKFAAVCGVPSRTLARQWQTRRDRFTWLARRCSDRTAARVTDWKLPGVYPTWEYDRAYPAAIPGVLDPLGFVNADLVGAAGLECRYDELLRGSDGRGVFLADAVGRRFAVDPVAGQKPVPGCNLHLTLDARWQSILAEELTAAVVKWRANWGVALLMDPYTGAVVAMADVDTRDRKGKGQKCRLVSDVIEPGSTFKIVTYAAALSDGVVHPGEYFDGGDGVGVFSGRRIRDDKKHAVISVAEAFSLSSNVVTGRIANRLEPGRLDLWVRQLGFGQKTGIDLPGESSGRIAVQRHSEYNVATRAIGHGVAVTPLQLAVACAAIANGGYLVQPHLVAAVESPRGRQYTTTAGHRVLRPEVASVLRGFMQRTVTEGTAKPIADPRFPIAGKTGTAEKPDPRTGRYDKTKFIASFVGFYPAECPRLVGLVILDEPEPIHYGGYTAAPVLLNTIRRAASAGNVPTDPRPLFAQGRVAETLMTGWSRRLVDAVVPWIGVNDALAATGDQYSIIENEDSNERNDACAGVTGWDRLQGAAAVKEPAAADTSTSRWPDLAGLTLRDALAVLRACGADADVLGSGVVTAQHPPAQSPLGDDRRCRLTLR
ncbi:MAG TPA: penicillin-binding transpeptidase domain-containing protein, partial [Acidobacteriota bacterium]|nr:penicillin-binding transpeptidase domain-containing protein [Acidobacteriota bacterium]